MPVGSLTRTDRGWSDWAAAQVSALQAPRETPLIEFPLPGWGVRLIFKDESVHPSGSLKHRLASSLIMFGICNGDITSASTLIDASSGSTAVSEAFFARALNLPFVAVMPRQTSPRKIELIESMGGRCWFVDDPADVYGEAQRLGAQPDWIYLDQFTNASLRTNWRSENVASALFDQLRVLGMPDPDWVVVGAGTGGTSSTLARYARLHGLHTEIAVADPEGSAFYPAWLHGTRDVTGTASRIEGIGRPRVEPSFVPQILGAVIPVADNESVAGMRVLGRRGIDSGPSTGTNLVAALAIAERLRASGRPGLIASVICDSADRYTDTYFDAAWLDRQGLRPDAAELELERLIESSAGVIHASA